MPIHCPISIANLGPREFEEIDFRVMGHAFKSQNELGRLCEEGVYENDLKARLLADGFKSVHTQIPATVSYRNFSKTYRLDLVAENALYELKADAALIGDHEMQLYNYLFILGLQRGKLLNFRTQKVQGRIIATSLTPESRRCFTNATNNWIDLTPACALLRQTMLALLAEWGAFLDLALYQEALVHFLGGTDSIERRVALQRDRLDLGGQRMLLHAPGVAFRITAHTDSQSNIEYNLCRLLALTDLKAIQWINLNHAQIEFTTIQK